MKKNKSISIFSLFLILISNKLYSQDNYINQQVQNSEIIFFVDNVLNRIPGEILKALEQIPKNELDDAIIFYLIATDKYLNIDVKTLTNKKNGKNIYVVSAKNAKKIQNIIFQGMKSSEQISLQKNLTLQSGKTFKDYLVQEDVRVIEKNLQEKGYLNAEIKSYRVKLTSNETVNLVYNVDKGEPCRIDQITVENSNANILNFINLPIETGSICDKITIEEKLSQIKTKYWQQGYLTAEVKIKELAYSKNKERAKLVLYIEKGPKTTIKIIDEKLQLLNPDFLSTRQSDISYSDLLLSPDADLNTHLVNYYQNLGYPYVIVNGPERSIEDGNTTLLFKIKRGQYVKLGDIYFIGNLPEDTQTILNELKLDKGLFSNNIPFVQSNLLTYRDKLRNIFYRNGYADAKIAIPDFSFSSDGTQAQLAFNVSTSGDKYVLKDIKIFNLPQDVELNKKKLESIFKPGDPVSASNKQSFSDELHSQLLNYGYLYSQIKTQQTINQISSGTKLVTISLIVEPGNQVKIGKIYAQGDLFNKEKEIIRISGLNEGDSFSQRHLEEARTQLMRHDLFSSVSIEPYDANAIDKKENTLDIVIRTRARSGFLLSLTTGWGDRRGYRFGADYSLNQITEDGLRLIASASISQERQQTSFASSDTKQILGQQISLGFMEPLFKLGPLLTPLDISTIAGYQVAAETLTNREYQTLKLVTDWKPSFFDKNWTFSSNFLHEKSTSTSSESAVVQTIDSPSLVIREWLNSASLDTRDNISWPTKGGLYSFQIGVARFGFGSDVEFNRYIPSADTYFPIYEKLSGAIYAGGVVVSDTINRNGDTVTPPASRRATLTDNALIRGFPETFGSAAPGPLLWIHYANNGVANCNTQLASVGGTNLLYLKSEARYRLNEVFGLVAFVDSGESYLTPKEANQVNAQIKSQIKNTASRNGQCSVDNAALVSPAPIFKDTNFFEEYWRQAYISTGLGLRVILGNFAAISLDYGYPLKDPSSDQSNCITPGEATNTTIPPTCISRIQDSNFDLGVTGIKFKGAFHLGIGAKF